ncbi:MAG: hypothetical protein R2716_12040 [Microthrixaceae bacterium]
MEAERVVRRRRPEPTGGRSANRSRSAPRSRSGAGRDRTEGAKGRTAPKGAKGRTAPKGAKGRTAPKGAKSSRAGRSEQAPAAAGSLSSHLIRPAADGHKVKIGIVWFLTALGALLVGRWAITILWTAVAVVAAWQVAGAWARYSPDSPAPAFTPALAAVATAALVASSGVGTALAGVALIVVPLAVIGVVMGSGRKPAAAGAALIAVVISSVPAISVVLVARAETWAALFLVAAVSFYDAGYFIGAAESSSRLEGPVTGGIGLLAVTFTASAFEAAPFDRASAWIAGVLMLVACPLGQMLTSAELPEPAAAAPAMRRLDSYLVAAPLMLVAVWSLGSV